MSTAIFFGGLVVGFLSGWICMVLLTMTSERNQQATWPMALVYYRISAAQESDQDEIA